MSKATIVVSAMAIFLLYGCASPTPAYVARPDVPVASVTSAITGAYDRNEQIEIFVLGEGTCSLIKNEPIEKQRRLFYVNKSLTTPAGFQSVETGKRVRFRYLEQASGGGTCELVTETILLPNKRYVLTGGSQFSGKVLVTRSCSFGIKDADTKIPVPMVRKTWKSLCDKE